MKRSRLVCWLIAVVIAVIVVFVALNPRTLSLAGRWLDVGRPPQKADAVVLLNGGYDTRPFVAAALIHGGWAPKLILNTVAPHAAQVSGAIPLSDTVVRKVLDYGGVPRDRVVLLESTAETTFDEAKAVAAYLAKNPARRLLIVTEGPHTRRSEWIFRRTLADPALDIIMVSSPSDDFDAATWWRSEAGFLFVVSEYLKLFFYGFRYGWLGYELIAVVAAAMILRAWFWRRRKQASSGTAAPSS